MRCAPVRRRIWRVCVQIFRRPFVALSCAHCHLSATIATAGHPICPELRARNYQYNADVHIGKNVWIGAGAVFLPGITVGDGAVIGAGAVVTRDIPADVVAVGNPCRVLRPVGERDRAYYDRDKEIPAELWER